MNVAVILAFVFIIRHDAIKFLIGSDKTEEALLAIKEVYKHAQTPEEQMLYLQKLKASQGKKSSNLTLIDALCNDRYRGATWVNVGYIIFHELTGINVIMLYSTTLFKNMDKAGGSITPRQGTYLVGLTSLFSSAFSVFVVRYFGRRTLVIWGHLGIAAVHGAVGYFALSQNNAGVISCILTFLFVY